MSDPVMNDPVALFLGLDVSPKPPEGAWVQHPDGSWWVRPPGRPTIAKLGAHVVTEHEDGTISVTPSIVYSTSDRPDYWHGYLTEGRFEEITP